MTGYYFSKISSQRNPKVIYTHGNEFQLKYQGQTLKGFRVYVTTNYM